MVIRPHDQAALLQYHSTHLKPHRLSAIFLRDIDFGDVSLAAGPVAINNVSFKRLWRRATLSHRIRHAAIEWLQPREDGFPQDALPLTSLSHLKRRVSLDHWHEHDFARDLQLHCTDIAKRHPALREWVECRNALIDYLLLPPKPPKRALVDTIHIFERSLIAAAYALGQGQLREAGKIADNMLQRAFDGAKAAYCSIMSSDGASRLDCSVNLMLPTQSARYPEGPTAAWKENYFRAERLWEGVTHGRRLMVVSESTEEATEGAHLGFWVPIVRSERGQTLPGATTAITEQRPNAVFKDDLPSLTSLGFSHALSSRWRAHMDEHFDRKFFVSLPIVVPTETGTREPAGVLNLNITHPNGDRTWQRAYHGAWLETATDAVAAFGRYAFWATRIQLVCGTGPLNAAYLIDPRALGPLGSF